MPRMTFSTIYTRVEDITNIDSQRDLIKDAIQWGLDIIGSSWNFPYLMQEAFITTVAPHTTGDVDVREGSTAITVGTTSPEFTSAMVGRKIRFNGQQAYYRIASVTAPDDLVLEVPYQGEDDDDVSYSIFKDEYRLPADLDKLKVMRQIEEGVAQVGLSATAFDLILPTPTSQGSPNFNILVGSKRDTYSTGTVSASVNTSVITGSATALWTSVDGLGKGSRITIGTAVYTIKSVDSATQITVYENIATAIAALTAYEILMDNLIIQFYDIPDAVENIYFRYQRIPEVLRQDQDIPDLPDQWHYLLVDAGLMRVWETKDKAEARAKKTEFFAGIQLMKVKAGYISQNVVHPRRSMSARLGRGLDYRTTGNRGRPFSL